MKVFSDDRAAKATADDKAHDTRASQSQASKAWHNPIGHKLLTAFGY